MKFHKGILEAILFINILGNAYSVTVHFKLAARDLQKLDLGSHPDGYVNIYLDGKYIERTDYILNNENPKWNRMHQLRGVNLDSRIIFAVRDYDSGYEVSNSKPHGEVVMKGRELLSVDKFIQEITHQGAGNGRLIVDVIGITKDGQRIC